MGGCIEATKRPRAYTTIATEMADNSHQEQLRRRSSVCTVEKVGKHTKYHCSANKDNFAFGIDISNDTPDIHICNSKMIHYIKNKNSHIKSKVEVYT